MNKDQVKSLVGIIVIILLFFFFSFIVQNNFAGVNDYLDVGFFGMFVYVITVIISIVVAPVSSMPLLPVASGLWGWQVAGALSVVGWTLGGIIAFLLARIYGVGLVSKLLPMDKVYKFEKLIPDENLFFSVVFFRMVIPVDALSYFLGLFSKMSLRSYTLATIIGVTPFAFVFSYLGTVELIYQLVVFGIGAIIFLIGLFIAWGKLKLNKKLKE